MQKLAACKSFYVSNFLCGKRRVAIYDPFSSGTWRGSRLTRKRFLSGFGTVQPGDFIEDSGFL